MIGIDLGSKFVKICKIVNTEKKKKEYSIVSAVVDISNLSGAEKTDKFTAVLKKIGCLDDSVYLAVGGKDIINRDILLKRNKLIDIKDQVNNEVVNTISEDLGKTYSSFSVIKNNSDKEYNIIFSAAPMEKVNAKFSFINTIDALTVSGVTLEDFALANAFVEFGPNYKNSENIILINIGYAVSNVIVMNGKELVFIKDIDFGGQDITRDISNFYSIPEKLSEELKRRDDLRQAINFNMKNILKKDVATLIETLFRTIEHCITRQFIVSVDRIVLTGGGAMTEGIDNFIQDTLGIPTEKWNPLDNNKFVGYVNKPQGFYLPIALGLALEKEKKANV